MTNYEIIIWLRDDDRCPLGCLPDMPENPFPHTRFRDGAHGLTYSQATDIAAAWDSFFPNDYGPANPDGLNEALRLATRYGIRIQIEAFIRTHTHKIRAKT